MVLKMKNFKRFIVIILAICAVMVCASCKKCSKDKNRLIPTLSDPTGTYLKIGNYTVTKKDVYYQLLNSYGTEVLLNMVDDALLPALSDEEGFQEYLDEIIYGDEEKTDEVKQKFLDELILSGLSKNPEDDNYYETYYRLVYRRLEYGKKYFKDHMEEDYFKDEDIEKAFENTYRKTNDLIIIRFDSRNEANYFMTSNNIDLNYLNTGWQKTDGTKYTKDEILAIFENIYKDINNVNESGLKTYTYEDLTTINSSLANAVYNWKDGDYSKAPTIYGSDLYLIYKSTESGNLDEDGNVVTLESEKDKVIEDLIEAEVSSAYATMASQENELAHNLKIYDAGLENFYKITYDSIFKNLGYSTDDYPAFVYTKEESNVNVFSYELNGKTIYVTADQFYDKLISNYGVYIAALYLKQYIVLKDNGVYDLATGTILDQEKYDDYYEAEIAEYKEAFENGDYASLGFDKNYGWDNFVRDYLGLLSEEKIIINLDSSLYEESLDEFKESLYLVEEVKDESGEVTTPIDALVQEKMEEIYNNYFNATAVGLKVYYDKNLDNKADEVTEGSPEALLATQLLQTIYAEAVKKKETITTALNDVILEYNLTNKNQNGIWKEFKTAGLKVKLISSASYNASSSNDEKIIEQIRTQYARLLAYNDTDSEKGTDLSGQDLSKSYTYTKNDVTYTVRATDFVNVSDTENDFVLCENTTYLYFVTKIVKPYYITSSTKSYKPTRLQYENYLKNPSNTTTAVKNCITTYYIPAINALADSDTVNNALMDESLELLTTITFDNKELLREYINACKVVEEDVEE